MDIEVIKIHSFQSIKIITLSLKFQVISNIRTKNIFVLWLLIVHMNGKFANALI